MGENEGIYALPIIAEGGACCEPVADCGSTTPVPNITFQSEPRPLRIVLEVGNDLGSDVGLSVDVFSCLGLPDHQVSFVERIIFFARISESLPIFTGGDGEWIFDG